MFKINKARDGKGRKEGRKSLERKEGDKDEVEKYERKGREEKEPNVAGGWWVLGELGFVDAWEQLYRKGNVNVSGWLRVDKCLWILTELEDRNKGTG